MPQALCKKKYLVSDEQGNVLILALILLVLLTMLGISASRIASIDLQVAGNNMNYNRNLFTGEAAAFEAVQNMEEKDLETNPPTWLLPQGTSENVIRPVTQWDSGFTGGTAWTSSIDPNGSARYVAVTGGVVDTGESLDMTRTKINEFAVYGRCDRNNGTSIVKLGYRKAY